MGGVLAGQEITPVKCSGGRERKMESPERLQAKYRVAVVTCRAAAVSTARTTSGTQACSEAVRCASMEAEARRAAARMVVRGSGDGAVVFRVRALCRRGVQMESGAGSEGARDSYSKGKGDFYGPTI